MSHNCGHSRTFVNNGRDFVMMGSCPTCRIAALEARCREREEYAAKLERRTDKSLTEHAAGCIADQERIAQLEVIARDVYNGFKKEAWEGANEYFNEHPEVNKHYGSPKETGDGK